MNEEQNIPDEIWRRAFDEAAETPPPRVWNAIERQLDEPGTGRVMPLWANGLSRPMLWSTGLAAAVALLLVGFWLIRTQPTERQPALAGVHPTESEQPLVATSPTQAITRHDAIAKSARALEAKQPANRLAATDKPDVIAATSAFTPDRSFKKQADAFARQPNAPLTVSAMRHAPAESVARPAVAFLTNTTLSRSLVESDLPALVEPDQLTGHGLRMYETKPLQRVVWFDRAETDGATQPAKALVRVAARTKWASFSIMPGLFNPGVSVAQPAYATSSSIITNAKTSPASAVNSRAGVAVAIQATAGVQLTDRWSVESGVGYLVGRSTVESPGTQPVYNFAQLNTTATNTIATTGNLYTDLVRSQTEKATANRHTGPTNDLISNTIQYTNLNGSRYSGQQSVANEYAYVQVPVQVGYELRPRKRLTLAVLGGLITNIFVKNTVDDALVIKAGDGIYEPVALVASMGARLRYRSSERWSASLAGVYQPALTRGTRPDSPVQSQPTTSGVMVGVDYHF